MNRRSVFRVMVGTGFRKAVWPVARILNKTEGKQNQRDTGREVPGYTSTGSIYCLAEVRAVCMYVCVGRI